MPTRISSPERCIEKYIRENRKSSKTETYDQYRTVLNKMTRDLEEGGFDPLPYNVTESNLKGKHPSIRRNTSLSEVFFAAGYVENWAMGIQRIMDACKANGNPEPMFEEAFGGVTATLRIRSDKKKPAEPISSDNGLDEKDRAIIQCILQNSSSSKQEIAEITSIPLSTVNIVYRNYHRQRSLEGKEATRKGSG